MADNITTDSHTTFSVMEYLNTENRGLRSNFYNASNISNTLEELLSIDLESKFGLTNLYPLQSVSDNQEERENDLVRIRKQYLDIYNKYTNYNRRYNKAIRNFRYLMLAKHRRYILNNFESKDESANYIQINESNPEKVDQTLFNVLDFIFVNSFVFPMNRRIDHFYNNRKLCCRENEEYFINRLIFHSDPIIATILSADIQRFSTKTRRGESFSINLTNTQDSLASIFYPIIEYSSRTYHIFGINDYEYRNLKIIMIFFSIIDNCNIDRISKIFDEGEFSPIRLIHLILHRIVERNDMREIYAFVIGIRSRIAHYLRDRLIIQSLINMRSRMTTEIDEPKTKRRRSRAECTILSLPNEILYSLYSIYHPDLVRVKLLCRFIKRSLVVIDDYIDSASKRTQGNRLNYLLHLQQCLKQKHNTEDSSIFYNEIAYLRAFYNEFNLYEFRLNKAYILQTYLQDILSNFDQSIIEN